MLCDLQFHDTPEERTHHEEKYWECRSTVPRPPNLSLHREYPLLQEKAGLVPEKKNQINNIVPAIPFGQTAEERMQYIVTKGTTTVKKWATVLAVVWMVVTVNISAVQADQ